MLKNLIITLAAALTAATAAAQAAAQAPADWANFGRFEKENAALAEHPKVVLMGNSITEGWIAKRPDFFAENGYASRAISGQTTSQMLVRFRADVVELHPQVAVICGGTNDLAQNTGYISLEHILDNIQSMAELARANGIRPVLCSVLPAGDFPWRPGLEPAQKIVRLNAMIRAYAEREGIPYVDYHAAFDNGSGGLDARFSQDGCHPTLYGYTLMEPMVVEGINKALRTKQARYTTPTPNE